jgi:hypothetical protein
LKRLNLTSVPVKSYASTKSPLVLLQSTSKVSDHRGSNSQPIDFEGTEILPVFTAKIENTEKSNTYQNLWTKPKKLTY